jgi:hypothetical protein
MILRHIITYNGQILTTPIPNDKIDSELENIKSQIIAQGGNPKYLKIKTDIELEESEYQIKE